MAQNLSRTIVVWSLSCYVSWDIFILNSQHVLEKGAFYGKKSIRKGHGANPWTVFAGQLYMFERSIGRGLMFKQTKIQIRSEENSGKASLLLLQNYDADSPMKYLTVANYKELGPRAFSLRKGPFPHVLNHRQIISYIP